MEKIDREQYQKRLNTLSEILDGIAEHAAELSTGRCPYKNRLNQCTAKFGCRNQRRSPDKILLCAGDDKLDYRSAWETGHQP